MTITGGCRCGAVRYKIDADRITARHCWCRDCQYIGAGSGTVNVFFPSDAVKVEGALSNYTSRAASGNLMHRQFCPTCGTCLHAKRCAAAFDRTCALAHWMTPTSAGQR
jgi:hypothetical protein